MRQLYKKKRKNVSYMAGVFAAFGVALACASSVCAAPASGVVAMDNIVVRDAAVDGAQVGGLNAGTEVTITGQTTGSDGLVWYAITYQGANGEQKGWVRSDLINATDDGGQEDEETTTTGTDANTPDETETTETANEPESTQTEDETENAGTAAVRIELSEGYVDLADVPEDVAAQVSDRFVASECTLADGTVLGYQLATADALVSDDAILTNYYYLYGTNEAGDSGWYVYDASQDSLQKSILKMSYSLTDTGETDIQEEQSTQTDTGGLVRMIVAALGLVCVLLLILAIVFSARYRRLRARLEDEERMEEQREAEQREAKKKKKQTENAANRTGQSGAKKKENVKKQEKQDSKKKDSLAQESVPQGKNPAKKKVSAQKEQEAETSPLYKAPKESVEIMDLDNMDEADYEALLGQYLDEHIDSEEDLQEAGDSQTQQKAGSDEDFSIPVNEADGYDVPVENDADYDLQDFRTMESAEIVSERRKKKMQESSSEGNGAAGDEDLKFL